MKQPRQPQSESSSQRAAFPHAHVHAPIAGGQAAFIDNSAAGAAQRKLADMIGHSPRFLAQRKQMAPARHDTADTADTAQRKGIEEEKEGEPVQGKFQPVQLAEKPEEEKLVQSKADPLQKAGKPEEEPLQAKFGAGTAPLQLAVEATSNANATGMPDNLKSGIENLSGLSMDGVRVHYDSPKPAQLQALAYAQGSDIHIGPGQERHLPHEAWHVVQQKQGRVNPTTQAKGMPINDDRQLEHEADVMGDKANIQGQSQQAAQMMARPVSTAGSATLQRVTGMDIVGEEDYDTTQVIANLNHDRASVHAWARTRAQGQGPFGALGAQATCNHHKSYDRLQTEFSTRNVDNQTISVAARNTILTYGALAGMPVAYAAHRTVLETARDDDEVPRSDFHRAMNYYIQKICDYPANLFFWPNRTGNEPDLPLTPYTRAALPGAWDYRVAVTAGTRAAVLAAESARVVAGAGVVDLAIA